MTYSDDEEGAMGGLNLIDDSVAADAKFPFSLQFTPERLSRMGILAQKADALFDSLFDFGRKVNQNLSGGFGKPSLIRHR